MPISDKQIRRFQKEIAQSDQRVVSYSNRLEQLYSNWVRDSVDDFKSASDGGARGAILSSMTTGRLPNNIELHLRNVLDLYTGELSFLQGRFTISQEDVALTSSMANIETASLRAELTAGAAAISSTLAFSATGGNAADVSFRELNKSFIEGKLQRLQVGLHTNLAGFRSSYEIRKAEQVADNPKFVYIGPRDNKNRPFCAFVLSAGKKEWTREEISQLDSRADAQLLPTFVYGGGFNCRHRWIHAARA